MASCRRVDLILCQVIDSTSSWNSDIYKPLYLIKINWFVDCPNLGLSRYKGKKVQDRLETPSLQKFQLLPHWVYPWNPWVVQVWATFGLSDSQKPIVHPLFWCRFNGWNPHSFVELLHSLTEVQLRELSSINSLKLNPDVAFQLILHFFALISAQPRIEVLLFCGLRLQIGLSCTWWHARFNHLKVGTAFSLAALAKYLI